LAVLIDTSAIYALLDEADPQHARSVAILRRLGRDRADIVVHSYVIGEAVALLQRRLGLDAVRRFVSTIAPLFSVVWVDRALHDRGVSALLAADRRAVSLVDHTSFLVMRDLGIRAAFAFDDDFVAQGFELLSA